MSLHGKRTLDHPQDPPNEVRAATPTSGTSSPATKNAYPCSNCGADHRSVDYDNPKCFICRATFPSPAARQAHYLSIHKRDSKRARFRQDHTTSRSQHTPPNSPFLSRSVEDMHNPSPYDSGYDSTFSATTPSSHGNSDIDDHQVDRYIRDQRIATLLLNDDSPPPQPPTIEPTSGNYHTTTHRDRNIALFHRLIANLPAHTITDPHLHASAQDYISDIAHSNTANHAALNQLPPVAHNVYTSSTTDDPRTPRDTPPQLVEDSSDDSDPEDDYPPPPLHTLTDDECNAARRHGRILIPRPRAAAPGHLLFDIRTATYTSDSTASHPDPSDDEDYPPYWPAYEQPSPPRPNSTTLCDITTDQLAQWTSTQLEWHTFRRRIPALSETPNELCGAPTIHRDMPNRDFMWQYEGSSPDTVTVNHRILGYLQSRLPS